MAAAGAPMGADSLLDAPSAIRGSLNASRRMARLADAGLFGLASDARSDQLASPGRVNAQVSHGRSC
jgi:hypothetical protein